MPKGNTNLLQSLKGGFPARMKSLRLIYFYMTTKKEIEIKATISALTAISVEDQHRLQKGIEAMPVHKIMQLTQWLQNIIQPAILKQSGNKETENYHQFNNIILALIWATNALELKDRYAQELSNNRLLLEFYRKKATFYESELLKYTTRDELLMGETFADCKSYIQKGFTGGNP